jgi:hypothetical protein
VLCRFIAVICAKDGELKGSQAGSVITFPAELTYGSGAKERFTVWAVPRDVKVSEATLLFSVALCSA